jgi:hypothetical protein
MNLWIFMIDDRFDARDAGRSELGQVVNECTRVVNGQPGESRGDSLIDRLSDLRLALSARDLWATFEGPWTEAIVAVARAMFQEREWALAYKSCGAKALPTLRRYLAVGETSVGLLPHIWLTCLCSGDPSTALHLPYLTAMAKVASRCVRLANDLRSAPREAREGGINAEVILTNLRIEKGASRDDATRSARAFIRRLVARNCAALDRFGSSLATRTGAAETGIANIARDLCAFYDERDFSL